METRTIYLNFSFVTGKLIRNNIYGTDAVFFAMLRFVNVPCTRNVYFIALTGQLGHSLLIYPIFTHKEL